MDVYHRDDGDGDMENNWIDGSMTGCAKGFQGPDGQADEGNNETQECKEAWNESAMGGKNPYFWVLSDHLKPR